MKYFPILLLLFALQLQPQTRHKISGCLIYTLGPDTTAFGNYSLDGDAFSMAVADITGPTNVSTLAGTFFPNGELKAAAGYSYNPGFWRTGADAATKITLSKSLLFGGKELPAGEYSIFTMPSLKGWTIMFNRDADIWGTEYNPDHDFTRVPMMTERLSAPTEPFTIGIRATKDDGGAIDII